MSKLVTSFIMLSLAVCILNTNANAETAKDAIKALKRLEAKCEVGISYKEYSPALGDAKLEVNLYLEGDEAERNKNLADIISNSMAFYIYANELWAERFEGTASHGLMHFDNVSYEEAYANLSKIKAQVKNYSDEDIDKAIKSSKEWTKYSTIAANKYFSIFPEDNKPSTEGGVLVDRKFSIDIALSHIWNNASLLNKEATKLLVKSNNKAKEVANIEKIKKSINKQ